MYTVPTTQLPTCYPNSIQFIPQFLRDKSDKFCIAKHSGMNWNVGPCFVATVKKIQNKKFHCYCIMK